MVKGSLSLEELQAKCGYWLDRLEMKEWMGIYPDTSLPRVQVVFKSKRGNGGFVASTEWEAELCRAKIFLSPKGRDEETLIHEILHILYDGHTTYDIEKHYSEMHERALNRLAKALMNKTEEDLESK